MKGSNGFVESLLKRSDSYKGLVLVVDDTPANLQLLCELLKASGYKVKPAPSGKLALRAAELEPPDVVLLDISMPEMDGFEVCEKFKESDKLKDIPIIFISALAETATKVEAFRNGGADYITKPFQIEEIDARVQTQLEIARQRKIMQIVNEELEKSVAERTKNLVEERNRAEIASKAKGEFLAVMSHEIRTPMNSILGMAELLSESPLNEDQKQYVEIIERSGSMLLSLINEILDLSKLETGEVTWHASEFTFPEIVQQVQLLLKPLADKKNIKFSISLQGPTDIPVLGDPLKLKQVITNLTGNAIKFTMQGEVSVKITMEKTSESVLEVQFEVKDTGIGIPKEQWDSIFEAFTQGDSSISRTFGGAGLGLTIVKNIIDHMRGKIWLTSEMGVGTTFFVKFALPISKGPS